MPSKPSRRLTDTLTRHQVFLERLKTAEAQDFAATFNRIDKAIRETLLLLESDTMDGMSKKQLNALLIDLQAANETILHKSAETFYSRLEAISGSEVDFQKNLFANLKADLELVMPSARVAFASAMAQPLSATGDLLTPFVENFHKNEIKRVNNAVQRAWGEGWTNQRLIQAIRGTKAANFKDGILATSRRNAETIARTSIQHVANASTLAVFEKNSDIIEKYSLLATLDGKTSIICRSLDKEVYDMGKGPVPPLHPNCRTAIVPELGAEFDFLREGETRSSLNGYVDGDLSYYEWLKTQPASFQIEALGESRAKLFADGGLSADEFARLNLNRNFQPLTLEEMKAKEPLAFERAGLN